MASDDAGIDGMAWVVWRLAVGDPQRRIPVDLVDSVNANVGNIAAIHHCVFMGYDDTSLVHPESALYTWHVRIPREQHLPEGGIPTVIDEIHGFLRHAIGVDGWIVSPEPRRSAVYAGQTALRDEYWGLISEIERVLLPLRWGGAETIKPEIVITEPTGHPDTRTRSGTYTFWLCPDPDSPADTPLWTVGYAGLRLVPGWASSPSLTARLEDMGREIPRLVAPRPLEFTTWCVLLTTNGFDPGRAPLFDDLLAMRLQWISPNPAALVQRVAADVQRLFPPSSD